MLGYVMSLYYIDCIIIIMLYYTGGGGGRVHVPDEFLQALRHLHEREPGLHEGHFTL